MSDVDSINTQMQDSSESVIEKKFDCFLSYSTDPDYKLVTTVEKFLESFHKNFSKQQKGELEISPLKVCVDESDLDFTSVEQGPDSLNPITQAIENGLKLSKWLIVFCSKNAMESKWVHEEIEWWANNFGTAKIKLVLTDPDEPVEGLFSHQIYELKLDEKPWIDLRGWKSHGNNKDGKVRDSYEQLVQLASLVQCPPKTKGELWPSWKREFDRQKRRKFVLLASLAFLFFISIAGGIGIRHWFLRTRAIEVLETFNATVTEQSTELRMNYAPVDPQYDWRQFGRSVRQLPSLRVFRVVDCEFETIEFLSAHKHLKELGLNNCSKVQSFGTLSKFKNLTFLELSETAISDSEANEIAWPKHLKEVSLCRCKNLTSVGVSELLERCQEITKLKLSAESITPGVLSQLNRSQVQKLTVDGRLNPDLRSKLKQRFDFHQVGVSESTGPLL